MTRIFERLLLGIVAALALWPAPQARAEHRDAPTIDNYSAINVNDVFLFRDPPSCNPASVGCNLVMVLSTQALADPLFGPSYHFQENALYRLNFTTRTDARPTAQIDFVFGPFGNSPNCPAPQPPCQIYKAVFPNGVVIIGRATQGTSAPTPNPADITTAGNIKVFAGPREDPFFFDLVGFNRATATGDPSKFTGVDAFRGKNVNAIVVEFPGSMVFPANSCASTNPSLPITPCGVWAATYLGDFKGDDLNQFEPRPEKLRQIDRMGNPLVNRALIPPALNDAFNFGEPKDDQTNFAGIIANQILTLDQRFGTCPPSETNASNCNPFVPLLTSLVVPDVLRFAVNVSDGYPNGRQLADHTTDLLIGLIVQMDKLAGPLPFTDGTQPKEACPAFPFLAPPLQLTDATIPPVQPNPLPCP